MPCVPAGAVPCLAQWGAADEVAGLPARLCIEGARRHGGCRGTGHAWQQPSPSCIRHGQATTVSVAHGGLHWQRRQGTHGDCQRLPCAVPRGVAEHLVILPNTGHSAVLPANLYNRFQHSTRAIPARRASTARHGTAHRACRYGHYKTASHFAQHLVIRTCCRQTSITVL